MDLTTALLFVGADNATGTLDVPRIESLVVSRPGVRTATGKACPRTPRW
jgi:hypothetical protein